jgi:hypothetical protein
VQGLHKRLAMHLVVHLCMKLVHQPNGMQILAQREAPGGQQAAGIHQTQVADTGVVVVAKLQTLAKRPFLPVGLAAGPAEQALVGDHHQPPDKMQSGVEVNLQRRQNVLLCSEL